MYSQNYGLPKTWLHNCVKSPVSEDPSTSSMVNKRKNCLPYFLIILNEIELEKVSFNDMQNLKTVC